MTYDVFQQVFSFAMLADRINNQQGTSKELQQALQQTLTTQIKQVMKGWGLAWGPTVWKYKPEECTPPANSWCILYHPNLKFEDGSVHPTYVLALAGTPLGSQYVLDKEDFSVDTVADFHGWVTGGIKNSPVSVTAKDVAPGVPYVACGTVSTTQLLLTTPSPQGSVAPGTTLIDFLASLNLNHHPSPRFIVTGHSLGGCLTPPIALALVSAGVIHAGNTLTYPIAGSSPGNAVFADLFSKVFPPHKSPGAHSYQGWNLNLVNTLDAVPQFWCQIKTVCPQQNMYNIPSIYGTPVVEDVQKWIVQYAASALSSGVVYKPIPSQYFTGSAPTSTPTTTTEFVQQALMEHGTPYCQEVGISMSKADAPSVTALNGVSKKSGDESLFNYVGLAGLKWASKHPEEVQKGFEKVGGTAQAQTFLKVNELM